MAALERIFEAIVKESAISLTELFDKSFETKSFGGKPWTKRLRTRRGSLLVDSGALRRSIKYSINGNKITWTSDLPYAAIHNTGGKIKVTPKMKRFFWAKYNEYNKKIKKGKKGQVLQSKANKNNYDEAQFWKAMALKKVGTFIKIPQRQFIGESPDVKQRIEKITNKYVNKLLETMAKRQTH